MAGPLFLVCSTSKSFQHRQPPRFHHLVIEIDRRTTFEGTVYKRGGIVLSDDAVRMCGEIGTDQGRPLFQGALTSETVSRRMETPFVAKEAEVGFDRRSFGILQMPYGGPLLQKIVVERTGYFHRLEMVGHERDEILPYLQAFRLLEPREAEMDHMT